MICYEGCKFPVINTLVSWVPLSYLSFFMICDLTFYTVNCYEARKFEIIHTMVSCVLLSYLSFFMISDLISTVKACMFPVIENFIFRSL